MFIKSCLIVMIMSITACAWSQEKVAKIPLKITSPSYRIDHRDGYGRTNLFIKNKLFMSLFWVNKGRSGKASDIKTETVISADKMTVTVHSTYKWNKGTVDETRIYTNDSIKVDYTYIPLIEKMNTSQINLYFKFYNISKDAFSYTKFGKSGALGTFKDIPKGKKGICSTISIKNFAQKDIDIVTDSKSRMFLEEYKAQPRVFTSSADSWTKPYTVKGKKHHLSLVFDIIPAEGQKDIPFAPLKVTF